MTFQKPPPLVPGDKVRIIAPSGPIPRDALAVGLKVISERYQPVFDESLFSTQRYLAGADPRRAAELSSALTDPDCRAVLCARGGYGSMRILPTLPKTATPRALVGFSDITAIHLALQARGIVTLHGPVITQLGRQTPEVARRLFHLLESSEPVAALSHGLTVVPGVAEGPLIGGNLSVLTRLLGTPYLPSLEGALLLLEDIDERPYRLDRMWTHLLLAGVFSKVAGIVLGDFTGCDEKVGGWTGAEVLKDLAAEVGLPCASGFQIGHGAVNLPVPLGVRARLDATAGRLEFLEAAVSVESHA